MQPKGRDGSRHSVPPVAGMGGAPHPSPLQDKPCSSTHERKMFLLSFFISYNHSFSPSVPPSQFIHMFVECVPFSFLTVCCLGVRSASVRASEFVIVVVMFTYLLAFIHCCSLCRLCWINHTANPKRKVWIKLGVIKNKWRQLQVDGSCCFHFCLVFFLFCQQDQSVF